MNEASKNVSFIGQAKCCGAKDPQDWAKSNWIKEERNATGKVPSSCCPDKRKNCTIGEPTTYKEVMPSYHLKFKSHSPLRLRLDVY